MTDADILEYLLSHAPLERFYLSGQPGSQACLLSFLDEQGKSWVLMEDDEGLATAAIAFLRRSGIKVFDAPSLHQCDAED